MGHLFSCFQGWNFTPHTHGSSFVFGLIQFPKGQNTTTVVVVQSFEKSSLIVRLQQLDNVSGQDGLVGSRQVRMMIVIAKRLNQVTKGMIALLFVVAFSTQQNVSFVNLVLQDKRLLVRNGHTLASDNVSSTWIRLGCCRGGSGALASCLVLASTLGRNRSRLLLLLVQEMLLLLLLGCTGGWVRVHCGGCRGVVLLLRLVDSGGGSSITCLVCTRLLLLWLALGRQWWGVCPWSGGGGSAIETGGWCGVLLALVIGGGCRGGGAPGVFVARFLFLLLLRLLFLLRWNRLGRWFRSGAGGIETGWLGWTPLVLWG